MQILTRLRFYVLLGLNRDGDRNYVESKIRAFKPFAHPSSLPLLLDFFFPLTAPDDPGTTLKAAIDQLDPWDSSYDNWDTIRIGEDAVTTYYYEEYLFARPTNFDQTPAYITLQESPSSIPYRVLQFNKIRPDFIKYPAYPQVSQNLGLRTLLVPLLSAC